MIKLVESGVTQSIVPMRYFAAEAAHRDGQATDALFLTFNADLAFLESRLLDLCRTAGSRVTVVADADVWAPDVRCVTRAGLRYHVGLVATGGAFHPKISLLVGPKRALAVVGSGNLGMGGWQHNAELATVLTADLQAAPRAMADLRDLLGTLANRRELDLTSAEAINRVVNQLTGLLESTAEVVDTGHRLAASWDGALIEQLPTHPVDELLLTAAFHDPDSAAVAALLGRLQPKRLQVAIQQGWTMVDPMALERVLTSYATATGAAVTVVRDPEVRRYRHGKLIEWALGSSRAALTGSPNLTRMALLRSAPEGNFEVGILADLTESLFPGGTAIEQVAAVPVRSTIAPRPHAGDRPVATSAVLTGGNLTLRLARVTTDVEVQFSRYTDPDAWQRLVSVTAGLGEIVLPSDLCGGDRLRLVWSDEDGNAQTSAAVFVTDPFTAQRRPTEHGRPSRIKEASPSDLWGEDLSFLESLLDELAAVSAELAEPKAPPAARPMGAPIARTTPETKMEPWLWLQNRALERLGPGIGPYLFGLPPLPKGRRELTPNWTDDQGMEGQTDTEPEVDQEHTDEQNEESVEVETAEADHSQSWPQIRKARRRWCVRAAEAARTLPAQYRLLGTGA